MKQIKVFSGQDHLKVEKEVNDFLYSMNLWDRVPDDEEVKISLSTTYGLNGVHYTYTVSYIDYNPKHYPPE